MLNIQITNVKKSEANGSYVIYFDYTDSVDGDYYQSKRSYQTSNAKQAKQQFNIEYPRIK